MPPSVRRIAGTSARARQQAAAARTEARRYQPHPREPSEQAMTWRVGIVGAAAALLGASIGGVASYVAAREQSQTQLALAERQSRESAYEALLTAADTTRATIVSF